MRTVHHGIRNDEATLIDDHKTDLRGLMDDVEDMSETKRPAASVDGRPVRRVEFGRAEWWGPEPLRTGCGGPPDHDPTACTEDPWNDMEEGR